MPYQDVNGNLIAAAQNPYVSSGAAASVVSQEYSSRLVHTKFINDLLDEVKQSIKIRRPIKLFLVGEYGYGKTTLLNLIAKEFNDNDGVCIPIKFQEIVTPVAASSQPDKHFESLLGAILLKLYNILVEKGLLTKSDRKLFNETEFIDIFDTFFELLKRTQKIYILIAFDEVEALFSNLSIELAYFMSFLHSFSEKLLQRPGWALCVSVTEEYYSQIISEARQLQEARFNFKILKPLSPQEVKEYIKTKNSAVTLRIDNRFYPFEEEVIDFVSVVSGGVPRFLETICQLLWAEAEPSHTSVSLETARRIFSNSYRVYAETYFSDLRISLDLSDEAEAFLNLLFFSGGRKQTSKELLVLQESCPISYFYGLDESQIRYRLDKASRELRKKQGFEEYLEVFGQSPYMYSLTNSVFKAVFRYRERI
ncbi:P-loop NTPase fold protein [Oscillatoria acuminata]|uniref:AAA ATPase n=1 Tax=Oscillatoria acuminata PCC 6304 TaxID=56110 RepID=K9TNK5_9CYAN|nr:P-loop NTPase fold protein [Oscillatoria acuminata]AFY83978.1 AAA ATPase [Oscillatoria acuminata PCC 6304]